MTKFSTIEGIGATFEKKLEKAGVLTLEDLGQKGATPKGRKEIADKSGIDGTLILKWVNRVDLARIQGIGTQYADLLEAAGVDTVPELALRKADNLSEKLAEINKKKNLVNKVPSESTVEDWINQAKKLPKLITY